MQKKLNKKYDKQIGCQGTSKHSSTAAQCMTLEKYLLHPRLVIYFSPTPLIKLKLGLQTGGRLLIATPLDQSNYLANQQQVLVSAVPFPRISTLWKNAGSISFCCTQPACFDFSSFKFLLLGHILSTNGAALRRWWITEEKEGTERETRGTHSSVTTRNSVSFGGEQVMPIHGAMSPSPHGSSPVHANKTFHPKDPLISFNAFTANPKMQQYLGLSFVQQFLSGYQCHLPLAPPPAFPDRVRKALALSP